MYKWVQVVSNIRVRPVDNLRVGPVGDGCGAFEVVAGAFGGGAEVSAGALKWTSSAARRTDTNTFWLK
jgi:hypothetical protein